MRRRQKILCLVLSAILGLTPASTFAAEWKSEGEITEELLDVSERIEDFLDTTGMAEEKQLLVEELPERKDREEIQVKASEELQYGNLYYQVINGEVKITDCSQGAEGELILPKEINGYPVTSIGNWAFFGCSGLTSVSIPNSVTRIGYHAFQNCSGLTSVSIPNSVTSIGDYAFAGCSGLTSVSIPNSVTRIGYHAFQNCSGLTSVSIPNSVTIIENYAFAGCSGLTSVSIPNSVTGIGFCAFSSCSGLTSVSIPNSVIGIEDYAFSGCSGLTSVSIPNSVIGIGDYAFRNCSGLTSVSIPNSVTIIGDYVFSGCSGLTSISIPNSVTSIGDYAFSGCSGLASVSISNSVTSIGDYAFSGCSGLTSVSISNSVASIGDYAFSGCSGLTYVIFEGDAPHLNYYRYNRNWNCFEGCTATVYYPSNKTGWDGAAIQNYGGTLTWIPYEEGTAPWISDEEGVGTDAVVAKDFIFTDIEVKEGHWKYESVKYVYDRDIMNNITGTTQFQPDNPLTRAMFATVLYRMAGKPPVGYSSKFSDVASGKWYTTAILWASEKGIVNGYGDGRYGINDNITREQIAKMLCLYGESAGYKVSGRASLDSFTDVSALSSWGVEYFQWAVDAGMVSGKPNGNGTFRLDPKGKATRAECAKMLKMFMENYSHQVHLPLQ